jgi:hypothetical protein
MNMRSASGGTALHCAALNGQAAATKQLVLLGANPNAVDKHGCTPLILAAYDNSPAGVEVVKVLLDWGAMPQMADETNRTAAEVAHLRGNTAAFALLTSWPREVVRVPVESPSTEDEASDVHDVTHLSTVAEVTAFSKSIEVSQYNPRGGRLILSGSNFPVEACLVLGPALQTNDTITDLNLAGVLRSAEHAALLCGGLEQNLRVTSLDISSSDSVGVAGMKSIAQLLAKNRRLRKLDLSFSVQAGSEIAAVAAGLDANIGLETLLLVGSNCTPRLFGGTGVKNLIASLHKHRTLSRLSIARSVGCAAELTDLAAALAATTTLKAIDISGCGVPATTMRQIIDAIKGNAAFDLLADVPYPVALRKARELHATTSRLVSTTNLMFDISFAGCVTDEADALKALEAVSKNGGIASLGLQDCRLGSLGVAALAKLIFTTSSLSTLNLTSALDSSDEVIAVAKALAANKSVKQINLRGCPGTRSVVAALRECLVGNTTLLKIKGLSSEALEVLTPLLEINTAIADQQFATPGILSRCVTEGKLKAIRPLVTRYPHLVHNPDESESDGKLHARLLQADKDGVEAEAHEALYAVYKTRWQFDDAVGAVVRRSGRKFDAFSQVCIRLAEEGWVEVGTKRTVLHAVLDECRFLNLEEGHTLRLARAILKIKPALENAPDAAGGSPAEIAASCCTAPRVQAMFLMGIIAALQRKGRELKTAKTTLTECDAELEGRAIAAENEVRELRQTVEWQAGALSRVPLPIDRSITTPEVEIECVEFDHLGTTYWLDGQSGKVYSANDKFIGKLTKDKEIDFEAEDSDDEEGGDVTPALPMESTHVAKAILDVVL